MNTLFSQFVDAAALFAQEQAAPPPGDNTSLLPSLMPLLAIVVLFYFLLLRPQQRERARRQDMLNAIKKNDHVITAGGIYGVVTNIQRDADEVTVKVDESTNTKLRLTLSSIARVIEEEPSGDADK